MNETERKSIIINGNICEQIKIMNRKGDMTHNQNF